MSGRQKVFIAECPDYDAVKIRDIVERGMRELDFAPKGKVFVKPNVVFAYNPQHYGPHAYTAPRFVEGALNAISNSRGVDRVDIGEKSAIGMPTRLAFRQAGYFDVVNRVDMNSAAPVRAVCMDEERRKTIFVGGAVHDKVRINKQMAEADALIYLPKLKCHCVSKMTGAVKLNIGILSDDERSIRHDFLLNSKIADLLVPGMPDLTIMDAVTVGVGNEALPIPRQLGLVIMARSPLAADIVGATLLGIKPTEVPYLLETFVRGHKPSSLEEIDLAGDITSHEGLFNAANRVKPYDDEFYRWQDVSKELARLNSPLKFHHGPHSASQNQKCETGCVMGVKMFLAFLERFAGEQAFANARPQNIVIGRIDEPLDCHGEIAWLFGSCAKVKLVNAKKVVHIDKCFTTAADMFLFTRQKMDIPNPFFDPKFLRAYLSAMLAAVGNKIIKGRYLQDIGHFFSQRLTYRI